MSHPSNDSGEQSPVESFVELYRAGSLLDADELVSELDEVGIPARVENAMLQGGLGELPPGWDTLPKVMVPERCLVEARSVLQRIRADAASMAESGDCCLSCKEPMLNHDTCPKCGWSWKIPDDSDATGPPPDENTSTSEHTASLTVSNDQDDTSTPVPVEPAVNVRSSRDLWCELSVVCAVSVIPSLLAALQSMDDPHPQSYASSAANLLVLSICSAWVVIYLIRNNGESLADFGMVRPQFADVIVGILIVPLDELIWILYWNAIPFPVEVPPPTEMALPASTLDHVLMVLSELANAFHEELVFRAYLITRLCILLKSRRRAIVIAAAVFASYHIYHGVIPVGGIFLFGLSYGILWLLFRRLWPLVIGHAVGNMVLQVFDWW